MPRYLEMLVTELSLGYDIITGSFHDYGILENKNHEKENFE